MSNKIHAAEIFQTGTWNGLTFTDTDLDAIVSAFSALQQEAQVPLKFGHNADQEITDGQPAIGWVERVWKQGNKLLADFSSVPTVVFEAINKKLYKKVSIELLRNFKRNGASFPWVLDAVALLGADKPAVRDLKDLQALSMARQLAGASFLRVAAFTQDSTIGAQPTMTDAEMQAAIDAANKKTTDALKALEDAQKAHFSEKVSGHRKAVTDKLEAAVKEGRIQPRIRDRVLNSLYFKDDQQVLSAYSLEQVEAEIKENTVTNFSEKKTPTSKDGRKEDEVDLTGKTHAEVLTFRAETECLRVGGKVTDWDDMVAATDRVLTGDPAFSRAYAERPRDTYKPADAV
jgi:hypothetical protein